AWNVRHEGDGRAELPERLGEAEHHASNQPRQCERQGDREKNPQAVRAERRSRVLELAVDRLDGEPQRAHQQGKAHDPACERRAGPAEREHDAEMIGEERTDWPAPPERDQEQIAGDHRREHQRQMNETVEQRLAPKVSARQQEGKGKPERQRHRGGDQSDLERQPDRNPFDGRKIKHATQALHAAPSGTGPARWLGKRPGRKRRSGAGGRTYGAPTAAKVILAGGASASNRGLNHGVAKAVTAPQIVPPSSDQYSDSEMRDTAEGVRER